MRGAIAAAAVLVSGLGLYVSRGVLDQVITNGGSVRVAMLPPWQALAGFTALALLGWLWLVHASPRRGADTSGSGGSPDRPRPSALALPAFGLGLLVVPYLPYLPDWLPALQLLAGPLRAIVWLTVGALLVWTCWQARLVRADWLQRYSVLQRAVIIAALTATASGVAAWRLTGTVLAPAGDEPHYLIIAQSLWRDGDLKIENNHLRGDYREYYPRDLEPHYLTRGVDGEIYSIHPIGMPVLMAPVYALGGYNAVVLALILCAALAAALMWRWVVGATGAPGAATFAWAAVALTTPFLFTTFTVYPEIAAALAVVLALTRSTDATLWPGDRARWLLVGAACAALPWLSTKYAPLSAALVLVALARLWWPPGIRLRLSSSDAPSDGGHAAGTPSTLGTSGTSGTARHLATLSVLGPYVLSLAAWFTFFHVIWGTPLPQAPYGALVQTRPFNLVFGAPGLLFDQEYGLLPYAPVYVLAATGLWLMWRRGGDMQRRALEIAVVGAALLGTVGAFRIWWGGSASPGRPLASGLLVLMLPMAVASQAALAASARRAAQHLLLWVSVGVALILLFAQEGLLTANARDGTSSLLEYLSPRWEAWILAPTFIHHEAPTAWLHALAWLAVAALASVALARWRTRTAGGAALVATTVFTASLVTVALVLPLLPDDPPLPRVDLRARPRLPLLDGYDHGVRPVALRYDPLRRVRADDLHALARLEVEPGTRADPQPVRVLHNGRFSLPAGRYRATIDWSRHLAGELPVSLQVGRTGEPWLTWHVSPSPAAPWEAEFALPVDAGFVGFVGTVELERAIARIAIVPLSVVDLARRPSLPAVLSTLQLGPVALFFHDENIYREAGGFWVRGQRRARVSFDREAAGAPLVLRVHSGPMANRVRLAQTGWQQVIATEPDAPQEIEVPDLGRRVLTLDIMPASGFRPSDLDRSSRDTRMLGAWVEVVGVPPGTRAGAAE